MKYIATATVIIIYKQITQIFMHIIRFMYIKKKQQQRQRPKINCVYLNDELDLWFKI